MKCVTCVSGAHLGAVVLRFEAGLDDAVHIMLVHDPCDKRDEEWHTMDEAARPRKILRKKKLVKLKTSFHRSTAVFATLSVLLSRSVSICRVFLCAVPYLFMRVVKIGLQAH